MIKNIFESIYQKGMWGRKETKCGPGSKLENTQEIRVLLPKLIKEYGIKSILDAGCGDLNWMKLVPLDIMYFGVDIVDELIQNNTKLYGNENRMFLQRDITKDHLPFVDLIMCRDVLYHLSFDNIKKAINNFMLYSDGYIMLTSMGLPSAYEGHFENCEIKDGKYRRLDLQKAPFNFPTPIYQFKDGNRQEIMCLYKTSNLNCAFTRGE